MSPFSFLILLIRVLSLCPLVSLAKGLSILLIFSKNQLLLWLIVWIVLLVSTWLISALSLIMSWCLLLLGEFASFCSRASRCAVRLLVYALSSLVFCLFVCLFVLFWRHSELWVFLLGLFSLCISVYPRTRSVDQASLVFIEISLPLPPGTDIAKMSYYDQLGQFFFLFYH